MTEQPTNPDQNQETQPQTAPAETPPVQGSIPPMTLDERLETLIVKASELLDRLYELFHGDKESVTHRYLVEQYKRADEKMDRIMDSLSQLDQQHHDLERRTANFVVEANKRFKGFKPGKGSD